MNIITLARITDDKTVSFAVDELRKYLKKIDKNIIIDVRAFEKYTADEKLLWVGLDEALDGKVPAVTDKKYDDAVVIDVEDFKGFITGSNKRSVLIGVYRFLKELGVAFVRPSEKGEVIPCKRLDKCSVKVCETPSYRHRGVCIEGADNYEHVYNMIDWIPKAGMNEYFFQFSNPYIFFKRWYGHWLNETLPQTEFTEQDAKRTEKKLVEDMALRSLGYHAVGHGWTCTPLGYETIGWAGAPDSAIKDEDRQMLALVNGKRGFFRDGPMFTEYCYSNPRAVETLINQVVKYCKENPDATHIHFWLSDGFNNTCECEKCKDKIHADQYIELLNLLDETLEKEGIDVKLVFLIYSNLVWPPQSLRIKNPERFVLMFAPIARSYFDAYTDISTEANFDFPKWEKNKMKPIESLGHYFGACNKWFEMTGAPDSFDFDYHLWTAHFRDPGYMGISEIISRDVKGLERINLNGLIGCQLQRVSFPTNLPMQTVAETLWNKDVDFEVLKNNYLRNSFGNEYLKVKDYLDKLSHLMAPEFFAGSERALEISSEESIAKLLEAKTVIRGFKELLETVLNTTAFEQEAQKLSWELLGYHTVIAEYEADAKLLVLREEKEEVITALRKEFLDYVKSAEPNIHEFIDIWHFIRSIDQIYVKRTLDQ